jgi:hypothetical protein
MPGTSSHPTREAFGHDLLHKFEPFHRRLELQEHEPGYISAWSGKAGDQAVCDRVAYHRYDDGNRACRLLCRSRPGRPVGHDYIDLQSNKLSRETWQAVELPLSPAIFDSKVPALLISQIPKTLP